MIRSFFMDGIFGNVVRFIFDRFFGGIFTNDINFSNIINLKNCHFKDLTVDADKINQKLFKNSPFQLFSGHIGSFSIKFPSLNALLTESLEVRLDNLDILLVINDVDFSKAEQDINNQPGKNNSSNNAQEADEENNMGGSGSQDFDVYKKIINRILFNMKLKVKNICIRVVSEKPYQKVRLPIAPCFMLKVGKIEVKKNYEQGTSESKDFNKNQNYDIHIFGITLHMMANYELKPDEYIGKAAEPKAEFPFSYPNEGHPSTFFICACKRVNKPLLDDPGATINEKPVEPISIRINFSNDKSKSVDINIPNIEIMFDFLKIRYISRYVDKLMEWKKYADYKKALQEQRKSPQVGPMDTPNFHPRKGSFEHKIPSFSSLDGNAPASSSESMSSSKIRIAGCDIDLNYFQKSSIPEGSTPGGENLQKDMNVNFEGLGELATEPFELTAANLLDTSNVHINMNIKSIFIYLLKSCSAFLEVEFRRRWLFGGEVPTELQHSFNKKIPINYFQLKCTNLNLSMHTKESSTALSFSSFKILDVTRVENPLKFKSSTIHTPPVHISGASNPSLFKSGFPTDVFHSFAMEKSMMMMSGMRLPELKRNVSSDPNESMLFHSAMSDVTKDFLTMREVRKQIVDWDLDAKREHFCVNVIFKFNKQKKDKKGSEGFKTAKYIEDSIIHSPLNTDCLSKEINSTQAKPTLRFQAKGSKIVGSLDLPPIFINFYMGIIHDIHFLLHNASDSYKIVENWYLEQNQNLIKKWEQELREAKTEEHPRERDSKRKDTEAKEREKVENIVQAYYKRQNQMLSVDFSVAIPFIKLALNLENSKKEPHHCFCGFSSHYFPEHGIYNPIFKKEFVVTELSQLVVKVVKIPSTEHFSTQNDLNAKKHATLHTHVLFNNLDIYLPTKMKDENKVLMVKLLSISPVRPEGKLIIPSLILTAYENNTITIVDKNTDHNPRKAFFDPNRDREEEKVGESKKKGNQKKTDAWADRPEFEGDQTLPKIYRTYFQKHMNKHLASDFDYLRQIDEDSTTSLKVTLPKFDLFVSKQSIEFLRNFSKDGLYLVEDLNEKLAQIVDQERKLFTSFREPNKANNPSVIKLSLYVEETAISLFQDEKISQAFNQIAESKNKPIRKVPNLASSDILLDASFTGFIEKSYAAPVMSAQTSEMRCNFPEPEFEKALETSLKIIFRESEVLIHKNPKEKIDVIHLEVHDLLVVDQLQEKPNFGNFQNIVLNVEGLAQPSQEYLDEEKQYEAQNCIVYKQSCWNSWGKSLSASRKLKEPELFSDFRNKGVFILENPHKAFEFKNKNVISVGLLKYPRDEKQKVEIEARVGFLVLRSDFKLGFIDLIKDIASTFNQNPVEKKEEHIENFNSMYSMEKRESNEEPSLTIQCSMENIMIDINPYMNFEYCKTFGKVHFNIDPDGLDYNKKDQLFYADIRSLVALESITLKLNKKGNKVQFDRFEVSSLDVLLRQQKNDPNLKENKIILRSKEDSFFEREFDELRTLYGYNSHPVYLSGLSLAALGDDMKRLELKLSKVELNLYADTIPTLEKNLHIILCMIQSHKQAQKEQQDIIEEESKEAERDSDNYSFKEGSSKPKDIIMLVEDIDISKDYFAPIDLLSKSKSMQMQMPKVQENNDSDDGFEDVEKLESEMPAFQTEEANKLHETVNSMPNISSSFVSSSTIFFFEEENMHEFTHGSQMLSKKLNFVIEDICLKIFESYEFDSDPILMEIPMPPSEEDTGVSSTTEMQTFLMSHDQKRIEKLPKKMNQNEKAECIMVSLESLSVGLMFFAKNENLHTNLAWRASVMLENFEILDCFKNSKKGEANVKLFSKLVQKSPTNRTTPSSMLRSNYRKYGSLKINNTFDAIFECFENNKCQQKDIRAFIAIHPIEIYFGTPHYNFTKLFLAKMNLKSPSANPADSNADGGFITNSFTDSLSFPKKKKSSDIFISFLYIAPVELKMNLNLDISVINLDLFKNLNLNFPSFVIRGAENSNDVKKEAAEFYVKSVKSQLGEFIKDLPILRNIKNLTSATFNIFYSPYLNYRQSGSLLHGFKDGFFGFVGSVSNESANLFTFVTTMVNNVTNLTGIRGNDQ